MTAVDDVTEHGELAALADRMVLRFCPPLRAEEVQRCVFEVLAEFDDAPVRTYVALLAERIAVARLTAAAAVPRAEAGAVTAELASAALQLTGGP